MTDPKVLYGRAPRLTAFLAVALLTPLLLSAAAGADTIAQKRAQAAQLTAQLNAQDQKVSILAERVDEARLKAAQVAGALAHAEAGLAQANAQSDAAKSRLKDLAVDAYVKGGTTEPATPSLAPDQDPSVRQGYLDSVTSSQTDALDAMRAARLNLTEQRASLLAAKNQASQALAAVAGDEHAAAAADAQVRATLAQVQGQLAGLVAADQARQAAAARARSLAALRLAGSGASRGYGGVFGPPPPVGHGAGAALAMARAQLGKPYEWGGAGPDSYDCSGLTMVAWRNGGVSLSHSAEAQYGETTHISLADAQPGDLLFYGSPIHHVGIYVGGGQMIDAPHSGAVVRYDPIDFGGMPVGVGRPG